MIDFAKDPPERFCKNHVTGEIKVSPESGAIILFVGLLLLLAAGVPVAFALGTISVIVTILLGDVRQLYLISATTYRELTDSALITIPMFVLMANFLLHSGISDKLFHGLGIWCNKIRGGLAIVSVGVCVALAMCGGFGPGILTMGVIAVPAMLKNGYDKSLALGSVMAGGVLGLVIPPSIVMIIFGYLGKVSIGKLFLGGVVPGFLCAILYVVYIAVICYHRPELAPSIKVEAFSWRQKLDTLSDMIYPILLVLSVMGTIFFGVATPVEAAGIGAFGALLICIIKGKAQKRVIIDSCMETVNVTGFSMWILVTATLFGAVFIKIGAHEMVLNFVEHLQINRWIVLAAMIVILLIMGMFMDDFAVMTICAPIYVPIARILGFDVIWFSVVFILSIQVAYLTPPFGWALILMKGISPPGVSTSDVWKSTPPFVAMQILVLALVLLFPQIATWLPSKMF